MDDWKMDGWTDGCMGDVWVDRRMDECAMDGWVGK